MKTARLGNKRTKATLKSVVEEYDDREGCGRQSALRDLLTDLRHLADDLGLDIHAALDGSYEVYLEERETKELETAVKSVKKGDKVFWNDPDDGSCSREYVVKEIKVHPDLVRIEGVDGSVLECPPDELEIL